jgi:hypothetical protein
LAAASHHHCLLLAQLRTLIALRLLLLLCHILLRLLLQQCLVHVLLLLPAILVHVLLVKRLPSLHGLPALHPQLGCPAVQDAAHTADRLLHWRAVLLLLLVHLQPQ